MFLYKYPSSQWLPIEAKGALSPTTKYLGICQLPSIYVILLVTKFVPPLLGTQNTKAAWLNTNHNLPVPGQQQRENNMALTWTRLCSWGAILLSGNKEPIYCYSPWPCLWEFWLRKAKVWLCFGLGLSFTATIASDFPHAEGASPIARIQESFLAGTDQWLFQ